MLCSGFSWKAVQHADFFMGLITPKVPSHKWKNRNIDNFPYVLSALTAFFFPMSLEPFYQETTPALYTGCSFLQACSEKEALCSSMNSVKAT